MLVLARKLGEQIRIGEAITLTVLEIDSRGTIRLGITAPREVEIWREEILPAKTKPQPTQGQDAAS